MQSLDVGFRTADVLFTEYDLRRQGDTVERAREFNRLLAERAITREIGMRLALGAAGRDVVRVILVDGVRLIGVGIALGLGGAAILGRLLRQFLFDVSAVDPLTFVLIPAFLIVVAIAACYVPARRASRIAPLDALRSL